MVSQEVKDSGKLYFDVPVDGKLPEEYSICRELVYEYNNSRPSEEKKRVEILEKLLKGIGKSPFIETPVHFSYGCHTKIGDNFYANFNMVIVDDISVTIGDNVMFAPNVTITVTGHPADPDLRRGGRQFSLPVVIEDDVWLGANVVVLPGVTIGKGSVIGAGSVVTKDIPAGVVAVGVPCQVLRPITSRDKEYYFRDRKVEYPL